MKKTIILSVLTLFLCCSIVSAQTSNDGEITLTVSSDGMTKDEATKNALRSAIEQAYGAFVSANTTILNDELVRDEIITLSNGSIKEYKEIGSAQLSNGNFSVTLTATVSLPHLIQYAQSKGSECEFAGNTFGMEMRLYEIQKENELKVLQNLNEQLKALMASNVQYIIEVGEPSTATSQKHLFEAYNKSYYANSKSDSEEYLKESPIFLILKEPVEYSKHYYPVAVATVNQQMKETYENTITNLSDYYVVPITIKSEIIDLSEDDIENEVDRKYNEFLNEKSEKEKKQIIKHSDYYKSNFRKDIIENHKLPLIAKITDVLTTISLSDSEEVTRRNQGLCPTEIYLEYKLRGKAKGEIFRLYFRNNEELLSNWADDFLDIITMGINNFIIKDNTGQISDFFPFEIIYKNERVDPYNNRISSNRSKPENFPNRDSDINNIYINNNKGGARYNRAEAMGGQGVFNNIFIFSRDRFYPYIISKDNYSIRLHLRSFGEKWDTLILIPREDIGKYSKFWVEPKNR